MDEILKNIYRVDVPLPGSPLKLLNSYIIKGEGRHLLVDVGYDTDEGIAAIENAFDALSIKLEDTDIFLTHLHGDHTGAIERLKHLCNKIYISEYDGNVINAAMTAEHWETEMGMQKHMGVPEGQELSYLEHPGYRGGTKTVTEFETIKDGDVLAVDGYAFEVVELKGHTPGLMGLHDKGKKILICGDHMLSRITPNINLWDFEKDYLGLFLDNLRKVQAMDLVMVLPGHRSMITDHVARGDELIAHHEKRMNRMLELMADGEKTVYEISMGVKWDFGGGFFGDFPNEQKWFAGNEVFAHLEHLRRLGKIDFHVKGETYYYYLK